MNECIFGTKQFIVPAGIAINSDRMTINEPNSIYHRGGDVLSLKVQGEDYLRTLGKGCRSPESEEEMRLWHLSLEREVKAFDDEHRHISSDEEYFKQ